MLPASPAPLPLPQMAATRQQEMAAQPVRAEAGRAREAEAEEDWARVLVQVVELAGVPAEVAPAEEPEQAADRERVAALEARGADPEAPGFGRACGPRQRRKVWALK